MDARKLSPEGQADLRRRVVAAVEAGMSQQEAGRVFGISRRAVGVWVRAHRLNGPEALNPNRRGRNPGEQFALSRRQQVELLQELSQHAPDELGLSSPVWSRRVLADLIAARFGLHLSTTTVGHYLTRWGLLGSVRRAHSESMVVSWHRPVPLFVGSALVPPTENLDVMVAQATRGAAYFLCLRPPYTVEALQDFVMRIEGVEGSSPSLTVGRWPADQGKLLRAWRSAQAGRSVRG
ncbi:helix-turn-helix domain-containing protein [Sporichthya sp.]|uniref:helix-turn-helix domain-containing protein n=1 Tax=Sporichthya sp. TaxID=65475 RepID=UPI0017B0A36E|nr:helix-turn-helix domain-containing protein [Sporichthya sp.]MBA3742637.1 helix-turn-helix domain-containing protein [Sporichthya sp.]